MRKIEKEEERVAYDQPDKKVYHLCIVNLVIGYATSCRIVHKLQNVSLNEPAV